MTPEATRQARQHFRHVPFVPVLGVALRAVLGVHSPGRLDN